ncbi:MAG: SUKH-3 domain-containing protein [Propionibacteriaceae bacterium]|jgi:hypothetical protein|nr:SUKH-3 domain-containing protein [Propionibacteriaceae bacterium]
MDRIEQLLRAAGWRPGRRVDTSEAERAFAERRFPVTPAALAALREFSGLTVKRPDELGGVLFDGVAAAMETELGWFDRYNQAEGHSFTPIADYGPMLIMVDEAGGVWGASDDVYGRLGDTVPEALDSTLFYDPTRPGLDRHLTLDAEHFAYLDRVRAAGRRERARRGWWKHTGGR